MNKQIPYIDLGYIPLDAPEAKLPYNAFMELRAEIRRHHAEKYGKKSVSQRAAPVAISARVIDQEQQRPRENPMLAAAKKLNAKFEAENVR
jgi:hypothetical protein